MSVPKGTIITCANDHPMAEVIEDIVFGQLHWDHSIGNWKIASPPRIGDPWPRCDICVTQMEVPVCDDAGQLMFKMNGSMESCDE